MRRTACGIVMALAVACAAPQAEERAAPDIELIEGKTYTTDEVWPVAAAGDLRFDAMATVDPGDSALIHVRVTITTRATARRRIEFQNGCENVRLRLYASPERTGTPAWDSETRDRPDQGTGLPLFCAGTGAMLMFGPTPPPNDVFEKFFRIDMKVAELTQGLLPERRYYATAEIKLDAPQMVPEISAGVIDLWRPSTIHVKPFDERK